MKRAWNTITATAVIALLLISCGKNGTNNPVNPSEETYLLSGKILKKISGIGFVSIILPEGIAVHVTGENTDVTTFTDSTGTFVVSGLKNGNYTVTPSENGHYFVPPKRDVYIGDSDQLLKTFYCLEEGDTELYVMIRVIAEDSTAVNGVTITITGDKTMSVVTQDSSISFFLVNIGSTYILTPSREGFDYTFEPESLEFTVTEYFEFDTVYEFKAHYSGSPLHSISGQIKGLYEFIYVNKYKIELKEGNKVIFTTHSDPEGRYSFNGVKDGAYSIHLTYVGSDNGFYPDTIPVTVNGENVTVVDAFIQYNGPTSYTLSGKVLDEEGNGFPGVSVIINYGAYRAITETNNDGVFSKELKIGDFLSPYDSLFVSLQPQKTGYGFSPVDAHVMLYRQLDVPDGGTITVPDFTGRLYSLITAAGYFPLAVGLSWIYRRTDGDGEPYDTTIDVTGTTETNGTIYFRLSERGPWKFTDYRINGGDVYALSGAEEVIFLRFGVIPGTEWESGLEGNVYPSASFLVMSIDSL